MDSGLGIAGHSSSYRSMTSSKLDLFQPITYENGATRGYDVDYYPIAPPSDNGPVEFYIPPDPEKFIHIQSMKLYGNVRTKKKGTNGEWSYTVFNNDQVYLINNGFHSLWSNVIIKINDTEFGDSGTNSYAYKSYINTLLAARERCADTILYSSFFMKDTLQHMDSVDPAQNLGMKKRRLDGNERRMVIPIYNDLMTAETYIPPNTKLGITLKRVEDKFVIMAGDANEYKIDLQHLMLRVRKLDVSEDVKKYYSKMLKTKPPSIPYTKNVIKTYTKPKGDFDLSNHNLFQSSKLPERVYVMMVEQDSFNGNVKKNPYNFQLFDFKEASLVVNNVCEPSNGYKYGPNETIEDLYIDFLENTGTSPYEMDSVWITKHEYRYGYFILAWDRSPTKDNGLYNHKTEGGTMGIRLTTSKPLKENVMVIVYASYTDTLQFVDDKVKTDIV